MEFTPQEQALLVTILRERQRELLHEIARAELREFRRELQEREALLESLLRKMTPETAGRAA
jgi:DNA repair exonuclease SbcCD nuclease subunit